MTRTERPRIGFIGLGLMGSAMVQRLLDLEYELTVIANRSRTNVEAALARGATEAASARELADASDVIMLCMDTSASVEARMRGDDGVIAGLSADKIVVDFGTSLPGSTQALAAEVAETGAVFMDAPLSRTPLQGREGKLNIMAAGPEAAFARLKPVLDDLGENVFHVGPIGAGHTLKLINNFFGMTVALGMAEAFAMADKAGLSRETLYQVMSAGPLHSAMMDIIKAKAIDDEIKLAFTITNASKDVGYYTSMSEQFGANSMMSAGAVNALAAAKADGWGDQLVPDMVTYFAERFSGSQDD